MVDMNRYVPRVSRKTQLGLGGAVLLALGAAGGAAAIGATRPAVEMAPVLPVAISALPQHSGLVTVKGRVAEVYGDRFTISDGSGKTMVDAGREGRNVVSAGAPVTVQGRYDEGQLRASFLVDGNGQIDQVGPAGRPPRPPHGGPDGPGSPEGRHGPGGPGRDGPPPPPPPGMGCPPAPPQGGVMPVPPQGAGQVLPAPVGTPRAN